jgi:hypothetical protein
MTRVAPEFPLQSPHYAGNEGRNDGGYMQALRPGPGLFVPAMVALGLGALAWYYLGPDLRRYMKIRSM